MGNIKGWRMVREESGGEVYPGTTQLDFRGKEWKVLGAARAPEGDSTGRVLVEDADGNKNGFYPSVFGLRIVPAEPEPEGADELLAELAKDFVGTEESTIKDMTIELLYEKGEEWGIDPDDVIATVAMQHMVQCFTRQISTVIQVAMELGRRQAQQDN